MFAEVIVALLIISPFDPPPIPDSLHPILFPVLKRFDHDAELWIYGGNYGQWPQEILWTRRALREVWNAPPLAEADRLPSWNVAISALQANRAFCLQLDARRATLLHRWDDFTEAIGEAERRACVWELVRDATAPACSWCHRRKALAVLRDMHPGAYYSGEWPGPVPLSD